MKKQLKLWAVLMIASFVLAILLIIYWFVKGSGEFNIFIVTSALSLVVSGYVFTIGQKLGFYENETN